MPLRKGMSFGLPIQNNCFVGRGKYLRKLQQLLVSRGQGSPASQDATRCIIHSASGLGKTEVAVEFAYRNHNYFDCIFFLDGSSKSVLQDELKCLAKYLNICTTSETVIDKIRETFEQSKLRWLFIVDDLDFEFENPLTEAEYGSIVVTTRRESINHLEHTITIEALNEEKGAALMRKYLEWTHHGKLPPSFKDAELQEISRKFENHPPDLLKVVDASVKCESSHQILQSLNERNPVSSVLGEDSTGTRINLMRFPRSSLNLLLVIAYLDGDFIPYELLKSVGDIPLDIGCADFFKMRTTLKPLRKKGLISPKDDGLSIERALQLEILGWLDLFTALRDSAFSSACYLVGRMIPSPDILQRVVSSDSDSPDRGVIPHAIRLYENLHQRPGNKMASLALALTFTKAGQDCWVRMSPIEGNTLLKAALVIVQALRSRKESAGHASGSQYIFQSYDQTPRAYERAERLEGEICALLGALSTHNGLQARQASMTYRRSALQIRLRQMRKKESAFTITQDDELFLQNAYSDLVSACSIRGILVKRIE